MNEETKPFIKIGADGIDVHALESEILAAVAEKRRSGAYDDEIVARAERNNLLTLKDDGEFLDRYVRCMRQIVAVDINDFEIHERRSAVAPLVKALKKAIWHLLKFYTFRLWSQQNQTNELLLAAIDVINRRSEKRIKALEEKVRLLEGRGE